MLALRVSGLIKDVPANSHLQFDVAIPWSSTAGLKRVYL